MMTRDVEGRDALRASRGAEGRPAPVPAGRAEAGWRPAGRSLAAAGFAALAMLAAGCSMDGLLNSDELPPDISDPAIIETPEGAVAAYHGTVTQLAAAFGSRFGFVRYGGLLADELQSSDKSFGSNEVDLRAMPEGGEVQQGAPQPYGSLQRVRGQAAQAIGLLARYAPGSEALVGHAYALQGYAEIFLAELYCSGIPLSTLDFEGDYTYRPGSSTGQVLEHALAALDTALALAADSADLMHLARVGRGRALLGLGRFEDAAAAVAEVPDGFRYALHYSADAPNFAALATSGDRWPISVADRQGVNGLDYRSSGDPRTPTTRLGTSQSGVDIYHPDRYASDGSSPIVMASGVEARLIEAEAALRAGRDWLGILNALRTDGTYTTQPNPDDPAQTDTLWNPGGGGVGGLAPLGDPGTAEARVDLLFRERALWLFLTGHRQGDLRRLIRHYGRAQDQVYPVGLYPGLPGAMFGSDVDVPVPEAESVSNPLYTGCAARGA